MTLPTQARKRFHCLTPHGQKRPVSSVVDTFGFAYVCMLRPVDVGSIYERKTYRPRLRSERMKELCCEAPVSFRILREVKEAEIMAMAGTDDIMDGWWYEVIAD
jgi:hypothetical protein